ncbi:MAG: PepSY domain-containing protein [Gemmatimonadaceae bacterium]
MAHSFKGLMLPFAGALVVAGAALAPLAAQDPQPKYQRDLPAALLKQATVSEQNAAKTALAKIPTGRIQAVELENESGRLIYSYELKVPGRTGIEEVNVNAKTGAVVNVEHETPGAEKGEAKAEKGGKPAKAGA